MQIWEVPYNIDHFEEDDDDEVEEDDQESAKSFDDDFMDDKPGNNMLESIILLEQKKNYLETMPTRQKKIEEWTCKVQALLTELKFDNIDRLTKFILKTNEVDNRLTDLDHLDLNLNEDTLTAMEYIPITQDCTLKSREESWLKGGEDEEYEEDLNWIKDLKGNELDNMTYFTKVNEIRHPLKAGTQAWNCYGNRTNRFLLVQYDFCF